MKELKSAGHVLFENAQETAARKQSARKRPQHCGMCNVAWEAH